MDILKMEFGSLDFDNMSGSMIERMIDERLEEYSREEIMSAENVFSHVPLCESAYLDLLKKNFGSLDFEQMTGSTIQRMVDDRFAEINQEKTMSPNSFVPSCDSGIVFTDENARDSHRDKIEMDEYHFSKVRNI